MAFVWTVLAVLLCAGTPEGQKQRANGCFGTAGCQFMQLGCSNSRRMFILKFQYGSKFPNTSCSGSGPCQPFCCTRGSSDCLWNYTDLNFGLVYTSHRCWNSTACSSGVQRAITPCPGYNSPSSYAEADYICLGDGDITDYHRNTTVTAPAVAIHYDADDVTNYPVAMGDNQTWHCMVDTADFVQRQADVILVKEENTADNSNRCSSVGWSGVFLRCVPEFRYNSFTTSTPFRVSVSVNKCNRRPSGWAAFAAQNGANLVVTCGLTDSSPSTSACPDVSSSTTQPTFPHQTTSFSTTTQNRPGENASHAGSSNIGAVVGGVVGAVVVLVAASLGVFCYVRRSRLRSNSGPKTSNERKTSARMPPTFAHTESSATTRTPDLVISTGLDQVGPGVVNPALQSALDRHRDGQTVTVLDKLYAKVNRPKLRDGHAAPSGIHGNPRSPVEDPDYDRLGGKKSQSSSSNPAATYGRLGEVGGGGEDTDYSYDHLARGRQAAPDVIDSDYDTSALHVTSEGDYNVADFHKRKQQVINGSDYDVAEIVTSRNADH